MQFHGFVIMGLLGCACWSRPPGLAARWLQSLLLLLGASMPQSIHTKVQSAPLADLKGKPALINNGTKNWWPAVCFFAAVWVLLGACPLVFVYNWQGGQAPGLQAGGDAPSGFQKFTASCLYDDDMH